MTTVPVTIVPPRVVPKIHLQLSYVVATTSHPAQYILVHGSCMRLSPLNRSQPSRGSPSAPQQRSAVSPPHTRRLLTNNWQTSTARWFVRTRAAGAISAPPTQCSTASKVAAPDRPLRALMLVLRLTVNWRSGIRVAAALSLLVASRFAGAAVTEAAPDIHASLTCLPPRQQVIQKRIQMQV